MGALALAAAAAAVLTTGAVSSAVDGGSDPAFAVRIGQSVAGIGSGMEAHAAIPSEGTPTAAATAPPPAGAWQVQVGAFRSAPAAETQLRRLQSRMPELAGLTAIHRRRGDLNRVRIGGIEDKSAARRLCARLLAAGHGCFVVEL